MSVETDNPSPESTAEIERLEAQRDELLRLQGAMTAKLKARPNDYSTWTWWGFVIIGLVVGRMRTSGVWGIVICGLVFWIAGMFFCIFALDSPEVQSKIAIFLHRLGENRISKWLYQRALTIR